MYIEISKSKRKQYIKQIEQFLKNFNNYKVAIINVTEQLDHLHMKANSHTKRESYEAVIEKLNNELKDNILIVELIERSLEELNEIELLFIKYRYSNKWSIEKTAQNLGYSNKALFTIRNQIMDKLIISLGSLIHYQE